MAADDDDEAADADEPQPDEGISKIEGTKGQMRKYVACSSNITKTGYVVG